MINGSLINYFQDLERFTRSIKEKCRIRDNKHPSHESYSTEFLKEHLIDEILEMFQLKNDGYIDEYNTIRNILLFKDIDIDECKDVAAMCWAVEMSLMNDITNKRKV